MLNGKKSGALNRFSHTGSRTIVYVLIKSGLKTVLFNISFLNSKVKNTCVKFKDKKRMLIGEFLWSTSLILLKPVGNIARYGF